MEGICKASILDNPVTVTLAHFEQNLPLVTLKDIAPVLQVVKVPAFDLSTLQSCLYYIILVEQGVQERVADLKRCCIGQLSEKYIEQGMQFPILEYAQLCSRILSIKLEECLCLLFFMIYGRMASRQYVRFLMHRQPRKQLFRKQVKSVSLRTQSGSSLPVQQERIHLEQ